MLIGRKFTSRFVLRCLSHVRIRPLWRASDRLTLKGSFKDLHELESRALHDAQRFIEIALRVSHVDGSDVRALSKTAANDLVAGCELARAGYLKQAYSLWRSWFEQVLFALYFVESPIHQLAWRVKSEVDLADNPKFRLMLHQLLHDSGEPHPFSIVYADRFESFLLQVKASNVSKDQKPIKRATRILTALSQGVHGTYRPADIDQSNLDARMAKDVLPVVREMTKVAGQFWCLYLAAALDISEASLVQLRAGRCRPALPQVGCWTSTMSPSLTSSSNDTLR